MISMVRLYSKANLIDSSLEERMDTLLTYCKKNEVRHSTEVPGNYRILYKYEA